MEKTKKTTVAMLVCMLCLGLAALAVSGAGVFAFAEDGMSLLKTPTSIGSYVYDEATDMYASAGACNEAFSPANRLSGAEKWVDDKGAEQPLRALRLQYKVRMHVLTFAANHTVPTLVFATTANTETYLQLRANGMLYLFEDKLPVVQASDQTILASVQCPALFAKDGDNYLMEVSFDAGTVTVSLNGTAYITEQEVHGDPCFVLRTNNGHGGFSDIAWTTTSPLCSLIKRYPDPDESNVNLLDLPDYPNKVPSGVTAEGCNFAADKAEIKNYVFSNEYLDAMTFYRTDTKEDSDGADMDFVISADVVFGDYATPVQGWYGGGIIFGETSNGYLGVRLMQAGYAYVHDMDKSTGNTQQNVHLQGGSFATAPGIEVNVTIYYVSGKMSVLVNGQEAVKQYALAFTPKFGLHLLQNKLTVRNFDFRYVPPIKVTPNTPKSEETADFAFDRGTLRKTVAKNAITGDIASFAVKAPTSLDYFLMQSTARASENLYRMTGLESAEPIENAALTTCLTAKFEDVAVSEGGVMTVVFRHNEGSVIGASLAFAPDGTVTVQTGSGSAPATAETAKLPTLPQSFSLRVLSGAKSVTVYVDDTLLVRDVPVPYADGKPYGNVIGFGGAKATYTVKNTSYKYMEDVRLTAPQKEQFVSPVPSGEANTEYIAPKLPEPMQEEQGGGEKEKSGCGSAAATTCGLAAILSLCAAAVCLRKRARG